MLVAGTTAWDTLVTVPELPAPDSAQEAEGIVDAPGGCGANVACALAHLGHRPRLHSAVGQDATATWCEQALEDAGVDLTHLVRTDDAPTARAVLTSDADSRQTIVYHAGATPWMEATSDPAPIGHFAPGEIGVYPELMAACETVTYDPGQEVFHRPPEEVLAPLEHVDVLFANEHEADALAQAVGGVETLARRVDALVVTDREGQDLRTGGEVTRIQAAPADPVDPTGAGDAHSAGVVHGLAEGYGLEAACRFGSVLAAFAVEATGAQSGLPGLEAARERYAAVYGDRPG